MDLDQIFHVFSRHNFLFSFCSCPDNNTREVLKLVCDLYALDRIWKDIGTYRNVDYVAPNKAKVLSNNIISYLFTVCTTGS